MTNKEIASLLEEKFPTSLAYSWDNCGLLVGSESDKVENILLTLDVTSEIIDECIEKKVNLIITHHPVIFHPIKKIDNSSIVGRLLANNISVVSMHTNLDIAENGVNDCLANILGIKNIKTLCENGGSTGLVRYGDVDTVTVNELVKHVKEKLGCKTVKTNNIKKEIKTIAVCGGSGGSYLESACEIGADAFITGDVQFDKYHYANQNNILIIDAGHFETETVVLPYLKNLLETQFKNIEICIGENNINPVIYWN